MPGTVRALAVILATLVVLPARADDEEPVPIQRYLEGLRLGDYLREVQLVYPQQREWPSFREPGGRITKYHVERAYARNFPWDIDALRLGFKWGRLVVIQAVYSERYARETPLEKMIVDLSLMYGEPQRRGMVYTWRDRKTVLKVFHEEQPSADGAAVELHPSIELSVRGVRERVD
ncbi:MAG: hypothetical protein HY553_04645 [Elusimicrobia bacterium]|nr:hypothetical protein [Elusimicrobiota bacterium]